LRTPSTREADTDKTKKNKEKKNKSSGVPNPCVCEKCGAGFATMRALAGHKSHCMKAKGEEDEDSDDGPPVDDMHESSEDDDVPLSERRDRKKVA